MVDTPHDLRLPAGGRAGRLLELGLLHERVLDVEDLHGADEVAVLNSLRGWRPARLLVDEGRPGVAVEISTVGGS